MLPRRFAAIADLLRCGSFIQVRHRGGGRPGGRPTFNWKEKKELERLDAEYRANHNEFDEFKFKKMGGDASDLMKSIDLSRGDMVIDLSTIKEFDSTVYTNKLKNVTYYDTSRKSIDVKRLFGTNKPTGFVKKDREYRYLTPKWNAKAKKEEKGNKISV